MPASAENAATSATSSAPRATITHTHDTSAPAEVLWEFLADVPGWKSWNAGVADCTIDGPFAQGSWLTMTLPEGDVVRSRLLEVEAPLRFSDETVMGDITVTVRHAIDALPNGRQRLTYAVDVIGEHAEAICAGIASDFPAVLATLAARAEARVAAQAEV